MIAKFVLCFLLFIIYAFLGWLMEVISQLILKKRFINRGFLIGPICPIYGWGCLILTFTLDKYRHNFLILFVMAIVICSILEYLTSYFMEKIFKTRWWDYSDKKFNLNGRICLETMIPFGILGTTVIAVLNPLFVNILKNFNELILLIITIILIIIFIVDNIISFLIIFNFRNTITNFEKDATEEITKKVKSIFVKKGILKRRLVNAFPSMKNQKERLLELRQKISQDIERFKNK